MRPVVKRVLLGLASVVALAAATVGGYVAIKVSAFDASISTVYDIPVPQVTRSTDPAVIARGKHLAEAVGACLASNCHGADAGGGTPIVMGPLGAFVGPNLTAGGVGAAYSDGELVRLVKHGLTKGGTSLRFMPSQDFGWLPESEVVAIVSYLRSLPPVDRSNGASRVGVLGKVLDRREQIPIDVARRIDHGRKEVVPAPEPTARYGAFLIRNCTGCHGEHLGGGRIPGAPSSLPVPLNLTMHESGLKDWGYQDFVRVMTEGVRKNGAKLDKFMPIEAFGKMDTIELEAMWLALREVPAVPLGTR